MAISVNSAIHSRWYSCKGCTIIHNLSGCYSSLTQACLILLQGKRTKLSHTVAFHCIFPSVPHHVIYISVSHEWSKWLLGRRRQMPAGQLNPLNAELNSICHLLVLLAHPILHISRIRVNLNWKEHFSLLQHACFNYFFNPYPANVENRVSS
jgi:hypothetical protein